MTVSLEALLGEEPTFRRGLVDGLRLTAFVVLAEVFASVAVVLGFAALLVVDGIPVTVSDVVAVVLANVTVPLIWSWADYMLSFGPNLGYLAWVLVAYAVGGALAYGLVYRLAPRLSTYLRR